MTQSGTPVWKARLEALAEALSVAHDVPLAPCTSLRIGGPAEVRVVAECAEEVAQVSLLAYEEGVPLTVLGGGTNVLVADAGVRGIVLVLGGNLAGIEVSPDGAVWQVGAACPVQRLLQQALACGRRGLEGLAGIPGTLGGALRMNAGGRDGEIGSVVRDVEIVRRGDLRRLRAAEVGFSYRTSRLGDDAIVLGATLELPQSSDDEALRQRVRELMDRRKQTQPTKQRTAGCVFKNPPGEAAGRLIEAAGCKGWREGGAVVSERHANFIVNTAEATASQVLALARRVRQEVARKTGIRLELELRILGCFDAEVWP